MKRILPLLFGILFSFSFLNAQEKEQKNKSLILEKDNDPRAIHILNLYKKNFSLNHPDALPQYRFHSYTKIGLDIHPDSLEIFKKINEKIEIPQENTEQKENMPFNLMNSMGFLWEKAQLHLHKRGTTNRILVLDNRISGLQNPIIEFLLQGQSSLNKIPEIFRDENKNKYRFFYGGEAESEGRKAILIHIIEKNNIIIDNNTFTGEAYFDPETWALMKLEKRNPQKNGINVLSIWEKIEGKWFLKEDKLYSQVANHIIKNQESIESSDEKFGLYLTSQTKYFDFDLKTPPTKEELKGYCVKIQCVDGSTLDKYRLIPLTSREILTYESIDRFGKILDFEKKAKLLSQLSRGWLRINGFDFDVLRFVNYNLVEGIRMGAGGITNENFNKKFFLSSYIAYGHRDEMLKYNLGIEYHSNPDLQNIWKVQYTDDVEAAGLFPTYLWNFKQSFNQAGAPVNNPIYYRKQIATISWEKDLNHSLIFRLAGNFGRMSPLFSYEYKEMKNLYQERTLMFSLKYSPHSRNTMTATGRVPLDYGFPEVFFDFEKGIPIAGGTQQHTRISFLAHHEFENTLGKTGLRIWGGWIDGKSPLWKTFEAGGLNNQMNNSLFSRVHFLSFLGFSTMPAGKYFADKMLGFHLQHKLPIYFRLNGETNSYLSLVYKGITGELSNSDIHHTMQNIAPLNGLFQETGVEWSKFLGLPFDFSIFYRIGQFSSPTMKDNLGFLFRLSFLGF